MKPAKHRFRLAAAVLLASLCSVTGAWAHEIIYSPADSILYLQCLPGHPLLFRLRDGGSRIERVREPIPGLIVAFDNIPGHLFAPDVATGVVHRSTDYGETWSPCETFPRSAAWAYQYSGWCGELPGQSQITDGEWFFMTSDSWQTYDSIENNFHAGNTQESILLASLSYRIGCWYGLTQDSSLLCVTSDSGRTWAIGSYWNPNDQSRIGAIDELWGRYQFRIQLALDTGRTAIDSVFSPHPPPGGWHLHLWPTNHPGEAYVLLDFNWSPGEHYTTELMLYHILDYGARVDSFYHRLEDFEIVDAVSNSLLPKQFSFMAYPNPFNTTTQIEFMLPTTQRVSLRLYDVLGREVAVMMNEIQTAGRHEMMFDASGLPSGVYLCRLEAGGMGVARKMVLVK